jgi:hypothetical protein
MLHSNHRPPRRPKAKAVAKVIDRRKGKPEPFMSGGSLGLLLAVVAVAFFVRLTTVVMANPAPVAAPGDIVTFSGPVIRPMVPLGQVTAHAVSGVWGKPGGDCALDLAQMMRVHGALSVHAVRPDGVMVSWAGGPTAEGAADCRTMQSALLVSAADYQGMMMALEGRR